MKALLIVDMQKDFMPGGALGVTGGDKLAPLINRLSASPYFDVVVASKDWHPKNHGSFAGSHGKAVGERIVLQGLDQLLWPAHCVQDSPGAEFVEGLDTARIAHVFFKGTSANIDSYSAFFDNGHLASTGLEGYLKSQGITQLYIAGLTTDYCVKFSALDAVELGFDVYVIADACCAVNLKPEDESLAFKEMREKGVKVIDAAKIL